MKIPEGKILLVVEDGNNTTKYNDYLKDVVTFESVSSINEAYQVSLKNYFDLILIDLKLSLGLGRLQLERLNSLSCCPPTIKIRPREKQIDAILQGQRTVEELLSFLKKFFARLKEDSSSFINSRKYVRYKSILRVILHKDHYAESIQANTLDISQGGLFITTIFPFKAKETIKVDIHDTTKEPIQTLAQVMWSRPWDIPHHLPGIGTRFTSFSQDTDQFNFLEYINSNFYRKKPEP